MEKTTLTQKFDSDPILEANEFKDRAQIARARKSFERLLASARVAIEIVLTDEETRKGAVA